jgi:hypothetical protein
MSTFEGHVPGTPYELDRHQFAKFVGFTLPDVKNDERLLTQAFWAKIARFEAKRVFDPLEDCRWSQLTMTTDDSGMMSWAYVTVDETEIYCEEKRDFVADFENEICTSDLPAPIFRVTIKEHFDQPSCQDYEKLRGNQPGSALFYYLNTADSP